MLHSSAWGFELVRYGGAAYLIWLGVRLLRRREASCPSRPMSVALDSDAGVFRQGVITNVLNPKVGLFFLAFLPQFASPSHGSLSWQLVGLGLLFNLSGTTVNVLVAVAAARVRSVVSRARVAERVSGGILVVLGARVALMKGV